MIMEIEISSDIWWLLISQHSQGLLNKHDLKGFLDSTHQGIARRALAAGPQPFPGLLHLLEQHLKIPADGVEGRVHTDHPVIRFKDGTIMCHGKGRQDVVACGQKDRKTKR